jgi:hypothetical protein
MKKPPFKLQGETDDYDEWVDNELCDAVERGSVY